jgi:hypothetical protein
MVDSNWRQFLYSVVDDVTWFFDNYGFQESLREPEVVLLAPRYSFRVSFSTNFSATTHDCTMPIND